MKNIMKLAVITTLMAIGIAAANAQDTTATNVVLSLNVSLTGFRQAEESNAAPVRVTNKDIFNAFAATSNGVTVGKTGKLIAVSSTGEDSGGPQFFVREKGQGTNITDTSLSGLMSITTSDEVTGARGVRYTILTLTFDNGLGTDFTVSGFATLRQGNASGRGIGTVSDVTTGVTASVSGTGHVDGQFAVFKGTVTGSGAKAEVVEIVP